MNCIDARHAGRVAAGSRHRRTDLSGRGDALRYRGRRARRREHATHSARPAESPRTHPERPPGTGHGRNRRPAVPGGRLPLHAQGHRRAGPPHGTPTPRWPGMGPVGVPGRAPGRARGGCPRQSPRVGGAWDRWVSPAEPAGWVSPAEPPRQSPRGGCPRQSPPGWVSPAEPHRGGCPRQSPPGEPRRSPIRSSRYGPYRHDCPGWNAARTLQFPVACPALTPASPTCSAPSRATAPGTPASARSPQADRLSGPS